MAPITSPTAAVAEPVGVTLARMEGILVGVDYKVGDLLTRMTKVEERVDRQESVTQQLQSDAAAAAKALIDADKGRESTAKALKDADAERVASAKEKVDQEAQKAVQETQKWTPIQRLAGFAVAAVTVIGTVITAVMLLKPIVIR